MSRLFDKSGTTHRFLGIPFHFSFHKNILLFGIINLKSIVILWNNTNSHVMPTLVCATAGIYDCRSRPFCVEGHDT